jgi:hypothetical protein
MARPDPDSLLMLVMVGVLVVGFIVAIGIWLWNALGVMSIPIDILLPLVGARLARRFLANRFDVVDGDDHVEHPTV